MPWVHPWDTSAAKAPLGLPKIASTRRSYSGINMPILLGAVYGILLCCKEAGAFMGASRYGNNSESWIIRGLTVLQQMGARLINS